MEVLFHCGRHRVVGGREDLPHKLLQLQPVVSCELPVAALSHGLLKAHLCLVERRVGGLIDEGLTGGLRGTRHAAAY